MKKFTSFFIVFATVISVFSMAAFAQVRKDQPMSSTEINKAINTTINDLKAKTGDQELKCTGSVGHLTCTSKVAWVCPSGWAACAAPKGGTCCTQN